LSRSKKAKAMMRNVDTELAFALTVSPHCHLSHVKGIPDLLVVGEVIDAIGVFPDVGVLDGRVLVADFGIVEKCGRVLVVPDATSLEFSASSLCFVDEVPSAVGIYLAGGQCRLVVLLAKELV
jgi:hypothetical protein